MTKTEYIKQPRPCPQEWLTPFELSNGTESPRYADTMKWFHKLAAASPHAKMFSFGVSPQGRDIPYFVAARGGEFQPQQAHGSFKAIVLIQNGIHPGEIEGKDASMLLLREILITKEKEHLLDNLILLVIPILNVDGHERSSPANRPNQNGPRVMGWRTTSHNLNLNRDYMKADAPEMQALLRLTSAWLPDFIIDNHTTDGADFQYDITYGIERHENIDRQLGDWSTGKFMPSILREVESRGFLTAPYVDVEGNDLTKGIVLDAGLPRFSTGYAALQNRIGLLVETHSLKPFEERVFSTKAMNEAALFFLNAHTPEFKRLNKEADERAVRSLCITHEPLPLTFSISEESRPFPFKGYESTAEESPITGSKVIQFSRTPKEFDVPLYEKAVVRSSVIVPEAYCIPEQFAPLAGRLAFHDIDVESLRGSHECLVELYRLHKPQFTPSPYEGRQGVTCEVEAYQERITLPHGTLIVPTHQRSVRVLTHLLEPQSPDSYLQWGFFNAFFERKEYAEPYVMEPIAREMLQRDEVLREEFYKKLDQDPDFRNDPNARLDFFYDRSIYRDIARGVYPIARIIDKSTLESLVPFLS
jgi:murein tripeptide amidase MpaA